MLGEKIAEYTGRSTGRRVLPGGLGGPKVEVSFEQNGKFYGIETFDIGTYEAVWQEGGHLEGKGQGISMTKDGERISWTGTGLGRFTGKGSAVSWRGSLHYRTTSPKHQRVNGLCCVFEFDVDENDTTVCKVFEWR